QQGNGPAQKDCEEDRDDLTKVAGQEEDDSFLNVGINISAFFDCADNRGEVVVSQNHIGRAFADVRSGDAHGDTDVSEFQGRCVIDSVTGHGDDVAMAL